MGVYVLVEIILLQLQGIRLQITNLSGVFFPQSDSRLFDFQSLRYVCRISATGFFVSVWSLTSLHISCFYACPSAVFSRR